MKRIDQNVLSQISGGNAWNNFWESIGNTLGQWGASQAYSKESKSLHDIGTGASGESLEDFLASQNDPLL